MTYAPGHEKELFDRSVGCRVGVYRASRPASKRARTAEDPHHPRDSRRHLLCPEEWLPLAALASKFSALGDRLLVVREMARGWNLRAAQRRATPAATGEVGQEPAPERGRGRLPVSQDHRGRRRTEGIRWQQEGSRQEAPPAGGHGGLAPQSQGSQREGVRPGRAEAPAGVGAYRAFSPEAPLA